MGQKTKQQLSEIIEQKSEGPAERGTSSRAGSAGGIPKKGLRAAGVRLSRSELEARIEELKKANEKLLAQISELEQAERAARAQHYFRKAIEESISLGIIAFGLNGQLIYTNPTFCRMVGWTSDGLVGAAPPFVFWPPEKIKVYRNDFRAIIGGKRPPGSLEVVLQRKNGDRFDAILMYSPLKDGQGKLVGWVISVGDNTARKQAEAMLRRSEETAKRLARDNGVIAEIGRIISSTLRIEEVYECFAEEVRKLIPFNRININLINREERTAKIAYTAGTLAPGREAGDIFPLPGSATEVVMQTRSGLLLCSRRRAEVEKTLPALLPSFQAGHRCMLTVPLISKGEVIGSLYFGSAKSKAFTDRDLRLAENIGVQIAGAIANAQLFCEQEQKHAI